MHAGFSSSKDRFINDVIMDQHEVMKQLQGKGAGVKAGGFLPGKAQVTDDKKHRPHSFSFSQDKLFYAGKKQGRDLAQGVGCV